MLNSLKKWVLVAAALGGTMFAGGCFGFGGQYTQLILAILNEDLFG